MAHFITRSRCKCIFSYLQPPSPVDFLDDEIPLDQLIGDEGIDGNPEEANDQDPPPAPQMALQIHEENNQEQMIPAIQMENIVPEADERVLPVLPEENELIQPVLHDENELIQPQVANNFNNSLHVDMAMIVNDQADNVWARAKQAEATRLWARFFSSGNPSAVHVSIPAPWANFFTALLLSPNNFLWAKNLLSSKITEMVMTDEGSIDFSIPIKRPEYNLVCLADYEDEGPSKEMEPKETEATQSSSKKRSPKRSPALVETQVRRSTRLMHNNNEFKSNSCCAKKCLACATRPPTISKEVIKKLVFDFCKLDQSKLSNDVLQTKKKKSRPIARARIVPVTEEAGP